MDNNKTLLSNLKAYPHLEKLYRIQQRLNSNMVLQKAKREQVKSESCTAEIGRAHV